MKTLYAMLITFSASAIWLSTVAFPEARAETICPPIFTLEGENAGDRLGSSVSQAGDLNNDGFSDFIVGAPYSLSKRGRVYIYSGATGDLLYTYYGEASGDLFGSLVSSAGDVNGDDCDDVIIGATQVSVGPGRAYVYSGCTGQLLLTIVGEAHGDRFGKVANAGDVNSDGYADVVVGAEENDAGGMNAGRVYVFLGGAGPYPSIIAAADADYIFTGDALDARFGHPVAGVGDVNHDGYDDIIVGEHGDDAGGTNAGAAYVISVLAGDTLFTFVGEAPGDMFGIWAAGAGDMNGDGYEDLIVGADLHAGWTGRAYVYSGKNGDLLYTFSGEASGDRFGFPVAGAGDVNGDGFADAIVSGYLNSAGDWRSGRAYVFLGGPGPFPINVDAVAADYIFAGKAADDQLGFMLAGAGDVDGDGRDDVIVGARLNDAGGTDAGCAYVFTVGAQTNVNGTVSSASAGILGVPVDLYNSYGTIVLSTVTDSSGAYQFVDLPAGDYTVSIATPLGYLVDVETRHVSIPCGTTYANFSLTNLPIASQPRSRGYWAHQLHRALKGRPKDFSVEDFSSFAGLINNHFNQNQINPVDFYSVPQPASQTDSLGVLKKLLHMHWTGGGASFPKRLANAQLMALLLNVVSGKISQSHEISVDSRTISQAITYCDLLVNDEIDPPDDGGPGYGSVWFRYIRASFILVKCNFGLKVPASIIPDDVIEIAYKLHNEGNLPEGFALHQNYPNPFNPVTEISFSLPEASIVKLEVLNMLGQKVATLTDSFLEAGEHNVGWDASDVASGVYFYRLSSGDFTESKKMILLK